MRKLFLFVTGVLLLNFSAKAQDIAVLKLEDFDLRGKVKSCTVINSYGKEVFQFDENGRLISSQTQYSEEDTHWVSYTYQNGFLTEKRSEHYVGGQMDKEQSIINLYQIDTLETGVRITEKIVSFNKAFLEQIVYTLDQEGRTTLIQKLHADAVDEIKVSRTNTKAGTITEYVLNGAIQKWIRERYVGESKQEGIREVLTREYFNEEPYLATEERFSPDGTKLSSEQFIYDDSVQKYIPEEKHEYIYSEDQLLKGERITFRKSSTERQFVFQYDSNTPANWVKKIVLPDNNYTSRIIEYYKKEEPPQTKKSD